MDLLVGSTGFVGGHLLRRRYFDIAVHRPDVDEIRGTDVGLLVCAGLPAEKWKANLEPAKDWQNACALASALSAVTAQQAVLISTVDVYNPPIRVNEFSPTNLDPEAAYGSHRAWFEHFFRSRFPDALIIRLPGLYAPDVRKNLIHDLLNAKEDQFRKVSGRAQFQLFDVRELWDLIETALSMNLQSLNVAVEPVTAGEVAELIGVTLSSEGSAPLYDMRSIHAPSISGAKDYLYSRDAVLTGLELLREQMQR